MEALGVIGFVLGLVALGMVDKMKKDMVNLRAEMDELRGKPARASSSESK